jgi:hypothetical protein
MDLTLCEQVACNVRIGGKLNLQTFQMVLLHICYTSKINKEKSIFTKAGCLQWGKYRRIRSNTFVTYDVNHKNLHERWKSKQFFLSLLEKTSPKGFSASKCDVGIWIIHVSDIFKIWTLDKWHIFDLHKKPKKRLKTEQNPVIFKMNPKFI